VIKNEGKKRFQVIVVLLTEQVEEVGHGENDFQMKVDVIKGRTIQEKVFFIFNSLSFAKKAYSLVPRYLGNRTMSHFTLKIMKISSNP